MIAWRRTPANITPMAKNPYDSRTKRKPRARKTDAAMLTGAVILLFAIYGINILRVSNQDPATGNATRSETPRVAVTDPPSPAPDDATSPDVTDTPTTDTGGSGNLADAPEIDPTDPGDKDPLADTLTGDPLEPGTPDTLADAPTTDPAAPDTPDALADASTNEPSDPGAIADTPDETPEVSANEVAVADEPVGPDTPPAFDEEAFLGGGWKEEATQVLQAFLTATNTEEKIACVLDAERLRNRIERTETPTLSLGTDDFTHVELSEEDHRQGIFLMMRHADADAASPESHRCYAFFRRTDEGLKLDWEVFSQTRDLAFLRFIETPQPGVSQVFRVFITEDAPPPDSPRKNYRSYFIADLANFNNVIHLRVTNTSPAGRILSKVDFNADDGAKRIMKNATIELRWTDQPENPAIEISRFICWKFLGLGGEEIVD